MLKMGSNQFQREYIEYLQERNTELIGRLNHMKETYENKILSKDFNKYYLISALEDMSNICTQIPQEIDLFFDKMTSAMGVLKNILLRKSEMVQLVEKISKAINTTENYRNDCIQMDGSGLFKEPISEGRNVKTGTVKVSPMINGHIISTEPRIYLNKVPEIFTPTTRNETRNLSPIIETSPEIPSGPSRIGTNSLREITIPVERLNLNKLSFNYMSEESPKSRFEGPKAWKKSLSSGKLQSNSQKNQVFLENKENLNKDIGLGVIENVDPLEGPSWLHNNNEINSSPSRFIDYRRRKCRYATIFDKNEEFGSYEGKVLKSSQELERKKNDSDGGNDEEGGEDENGDDELYESQKKNDGKKDFEFKEKISESSVDLFCESYSSEFEENVSPFKKITERKETTNNNNPVERNNVSEQENNLITESQILHMKISGSENASPLKKLKSTKSNHENHSDIRRSKKNNKSRRKRFVTSTFHRKTSRASSEKTSFKSEYEEKLRISVSTSSSIVGEQKNSSAEDVFGKAFVKLEDFMRTKEAVSDGLSIRSSSEKMSMNKNVSNESRSPAVSLLESEGRKRRKAAPTVLVEPALNTKLRRN